MISKKLQDAINKQIEAEMWSANLYLSMSYYFAKEGYQGFAHWMKKQSQEEMGHAYKLADFLIIREGTVLINKMDVVPTGWGTPVEVFESSLKHEHHISKLINELVDLAIEENDKATEDFLSWFVSEQVEEEATAGSIVKKLKLAGPAGIFFIDSQLGSR